ncbi:MAG: OmpA family protein [Verrucomicrobiota bacterium]
MKPKFPPATPHGNNSGPVLIVLAFISMSVAIFFLVTVQYCQPRQSSSAPATGNLSTGPGPATETDPVMIDSRPEEGFNLDEVMGEAGATAASLKPTGPVSAMLNVMVANLRDGKPELAANLIGEDALSFEAREAFISLFSEKGYRVRTENPVTGIALSQARQKWGINLERPPLGESSQIFLDFQGDTLDWEVVGVRLPDDALTSPLLNEDVLPPRAVEHRSESLIMAYHFLSALMDQDYGAARALAVKSKVSNERLGALCIVFEEGQFKPMGDNPLKITAGGQDRAWVIANVRSDKLDKNSDFGLELEKDENAQWRVGGINLSKLISSFVEAASGQDPIIQNPKGGEFIVLYFDYDQAGISTRMRRQLEIIAQILKQNPDKTIKVGGHADSRGDEAYNRSLSGRRARSVKKTLTGMGVSQQQIVTAAYGEELPLRPNFQEDGSDNPDGRKYNRRTEIYLDF